MQVFKSQSRVALIGIVTGISRLRIGTASTFRLINVSSQICYLQRVMMLKESKPDR